MTMNASPPLLDEVLERLRALTLAAADPAAAIAAASALRAKHPGAGVEIVWEHGHDQRLHFDALVPAEGGVACLSYEPTTAIPLPIHGAMRWRDSELLCVDGRRLLVHEAMVLLDAIWDQARLLEPLVDACIVDRLLEREPWVASDAELQSAVDGFRAQHGLTDAATTERWLAARGLVLADLEHSIERELATAMLRHRLVGDEAAAKFAEDPTAYDRVAVASFAVPDEHAARACVETIAGGAAWYDVAQSAVLGQSDTGAIRFDRLFRSAIRPLADARLQPGVIVAAHIADGRPRVVCVHGIAAAQWDDATRDEIERICFARWLADARARADVRWNRGR